MTGCNTDLVLLLRRSTLHLPFKVKEAIHIRLHPDNINRDSGIEFQERGCPRSKSITTGEPCDSGPPREEIAELNSKDRNLPIRAVKKLLSTAEHYTLISCMTSRPHRLKKTSSMQSKRRDIHYT